MSGDRDIGAINYAKDVMEGERIRRLSLRMLIRLPSWESVERIPRLQ